MIKEGHQLASFYAFKDWTDCASFILNEKTEYTINIVSEQQVPIYPGIFTGCSDCVQVHSASTFQSSLGQVNWALLRTSPVPLNTVGLFLVNFTCSPYDNLYYSASECERPSNLLQSSCCFSL